MFRIRSAPRSVSLLTLHNTPLICTPGRLPHFSAGVFSARPFLRTMGIILLFHPENHLEIFSFFVAFLLPCFDCWEYNGDRYIIGLSLLCSEEVCDVFPAVNPLGDL